MLPVVSDIDFIIITGNILHSFNDIPIIKPGISLYWRLLYRDSAPNILLSLLLGKQLLIFIPGILLYQRSLNQGSTVSDKGIYVAVNQVQVVMNQVKAYPKIMSMKYES